MHLDLVVRRSYSTRKVGVEEIGELFEIYDGQLLEEIQSAD